MAGPGEKAQRTRVFLSYRRDDVPDAADRLYTSLAARFGEDNVFIDIDTIDIGAPFAKVVDEWIARSNVFLAMIGRRWLDAADRDGGRRLDDPMDYVRREIEAALDREIRVVPVLIHGAKLPDAQELPPSLSPLVERQAVEITRAYWDLDVERLGNAIGRIAESPLDATVQADELGLALQTQRTRKKARPETAETTGLLSATTNLRRWTALPVTVAVLVAGAIAFASTRLAGEAGNGTTVSEATGFMGGPGGSRISVGLPAGWKQIGATADAGLPVSYPLAVSARSGAEELILGTTGGVGPDLLPQSLSSRLGTPTTPQRIKLGDKQLYRFTDVTLPGASAPQTLYALPTTSGVVLAACISPPTGVAAGQARCERILESARISSGRFLAPGPSSAYAAVLSAAMTKLDGAVRRQGARLNSATSPRRQAIAARKLAGAYAAARSAVAVARPGLAEASMQRELTGALAKAERGYAELAVAAEREDANGYARAGDQVVSGVVALTAALGKLRSLGYQTKG